MLHEYRAWRFAVRICDLPLAVKIVECIKVGRGVFHLKILPACYWMETTLFIEIRWGTETKLITGSTLVTSSQWQFSHKLLELLRMFWDWKVKSNEVLSRARTLSCVYEQRQRDCTVSSTPDEYNCLPYLYSMAMLCCSNELRLTQVNYWINCKKVFVSPFRKKLSNSYAPPDN